MADPKGLAPSTLPQTTGRSADWATDPEIDGLPAAARSSTADVLQPAFVLSDYGALLRAKAGGKCW